MACAVIKIPCLGWEACFGSPPFYIHIIIAESGNGAGEP